MSYHSVMENQPVPVLREYVVKFEFPELNQVIREKDGAIYCERCHFVNCKKQGATVICNNKGVVIFRGVYKNNALNGVFTFYNEDGEILRSGTAQNGLVIQSSAPANQNPNSVQSDANALTSTYSGSNIVVITNSPVESSSQHKIKSNSQNGLKPAQPPIYQPKLEEKEPNQPPRVHHCPKLICTYSNPFSRFTKMEKRGNMICTIVLSLLLLVLDVWLLLHHMLGRDGFICCMFVVVIITYCSFSSLFLSEKDYIQPLIPLGIHLFIAGWIVYGYSLASLWKQSFAWFWVMVIASCILLCSALLIYYYKKRDNQSTAQHNIAVVLVGLGIAIGDIGITALFGIPLLFNGLISMTSIIVYGICLLYLRVKREEITLNTSLLYSFLFSILCQAMCMWIYGMEISIQVRIISIVSIASIVTIGILITPTLFLPYEKYKWLWVITILLVYLAYRLVVFYVLTGITYGDTSHIIISNCYMNYHYPWTQHRDVTSIEYADGCCAHAFFYSIPTLANLTRISFGNDVFGNVKRLQISSWNTLEAIHFGDRAFSHLKQLSIDEHSLNSKGLTMLNISSITSLESIKIQSYSLNYVRTLVLPTSAALQSIVIEDYSLLSLEHHNMNNHAILIWKRSLHSLDTLSSIPDEITHLYVAAHSCNEKNNMTTVRLRFPWLIELHIGADALNTISVLDIKSLSCLYALIVEEQSLLSLVSIVEGDIKQDMVIRIHSSSMPMITTKYVLRQFIIIIIIIIIMVVIIITCIILLFTRYIQNEEQLGNVTHFCQHLIIVHDSFNTNTFKTFSLSSFPILSTISIGKNAFQYVTSFTLRNLPNLAHLYINNCSFTSTCTGIPSRRPDSSIALIENCPSLQSIRMGIYVFSQFTEWKTNGVNYNTITFGKYSFYYAENAVFFGMCCHHDQLYKP